MRGSATLKKGVLCSTSFLVCSLGDAAHQQLRFAIRWSRIEVASTRIGGIRPSRRINRPQERRYRQCEHEPAQPGNFSIVTEDFTGTTIRFRMRQTSGPEMAIAGFQILAPAADQNSETLQVVSTNQTSSSIEVDLSDSLDPAQRYRYSSV